MSINTSILMEPITATLGSERDENMHTFKRDFENFDDESASDEKYNEEEREPTEEELMELEASIEFGQEGLIDEETVVADIGGLYVKEVASFPLCTPMEEKKYFERIKEGDIEAKEEFALRNLRLVLSIAKHFSYSGMHFLDLAQEGNMGLLKAIDKFDPTRGYKFSTYATWWIRQGVARSIADQSRTIRIPVHMSEEISKYIRVSREYEQEFGEKPNYFKMAELLHVSDERAKEIEKLTIEPISLQAPIGEEKESVVGEFIMADEESVEQIVEKRMIKQELMKLIGMLPLREAYVLELRYGLRDGIPRTLEEIGDRLGVTRERIRQIEKKAIFKLKRYIKASELFD